MQELAMLEIVVARGGSANLDTRLDLIESSATTLQADNASQSEKAGLSGWLRDLQFNRNKKICCVGDSTTDNTTAAMYLWNTIINSFTGSGDSLGRCLSLIHI